MVFAQTGSLRQTEFKLNHRCVEYIILVSLCSLLSGKISFGCFATSALYPRPEEAVLLRRRIKCRKFPWCAVLTMSVKGS